MEYKEVIKKVEALLPAIIEAAEHHERGRAVDMSRDVFKALNSYCNLGHASKEKIKRLEDIRKQVIQYIIKSAHREQEIEDEEREGELSPIPNTISLVDVLGENGSRPATDTCGNAPEFGTPQ